MRWAVFAGAQRDPGERAYPVPSGTHLRRGVWVNERAGATRRQMFKRLCQCIGLASLILVVNYGDLLGGGADVRMHVPFPLTGICLAQIADILLLGLGLFAVLAFAARTTYYSWVRLMVMMLAPPYLLERTRTVSPVTLT